MTAGPHLLSVARRPKPEKNRRKEKLMAVITEEYYQCDNCNSVVVAVRGSDEGTLKCCNKNMDMVAPDEAKRIRDTMPKPGAP